MTAARLEFIGVASIAQTAPRRTARVNARGVPQTQIQTLGAAMGPRTGSVG